ncbi:class I adenylate-forming enzyme family protein [Lysinibacillus sphaericus]|uniref:Acyl-CoA synthetase/AMP-acid ligase II n=1 Tax=Lysinibacillus sphaericus OT4b.31 TaxID=1285586 RepID=R7ZDC3_LYSSH|nr:long-chain-fatty-acid--CoA ligase [Lysinibacillus sphaericus]EON72021.1 acyl-CoA synthetase/AMP-acid ligase II [Lysinibacillus sphaericus OT4b.31]
MKDKTVITSRSNFVTDILKSHGVQTPQATALVFEGHETSYETLYTNVQKIAGYLQQKGFEKGDVIGLMLLNSDLFMTVYYGVQLAGFTVLPINTKLAPAELAYIFNHSEIKGLFYDERLNETGKQIDYDFALKLNRQQLREIIDGPNTFTPIELNPQDTAVILYTSGTTGNPKGVMLSHANIVNAAEIWHDALQYRPTDRVYISIPLFHCAGLHVIGVGTMCGGAALVIDETFSPERTLQSITKERVTIFTGVPTMYAILLGKKDMTNYQFEHVRKFAYGSAPMPQEIIKQLKESFPNVEIQNLYGQTESTPGGTSLTDDAALERVGSVGRALARTQIKIVDNDGQELPSEQVGEICIKGPQIMKGYLKNEEETKKVIIDGWLYTGDLGRLDDDGYLYIVDRKKDMIIRGGENIYPIEVENVLYQIPQVLDAAVIGIPHEVYGEVPKAIIALVDEGAITEQDVIDFAKTKLAKYKIPHMVEFVKDLPRNPSGKVLKHVLREQQI